MTRNDLNLRSRVIVLAIGVMGLAAGCTTANTDAGPPRADVVSIERGRTIAELRCAVCHALRPAEASPRLMAPPFGTFYLSYDRLAFSKRLADIAGDGAHGMPGYDLSRDDFEDLAAYLESNRPSR